MFHEYLNKLPVCKNNDRNNISNFPILLSAAKKTAVNYVAQEKKMFVITSTIVISKIMVKIDRTYR
jgi:hypothetical protein